MLHTHKAKPIIGQTPFQNLNQELAAAEHHKLSPNDFRMLGLAMVEANLSEDWPYKLGAVIYRRSEVVSKGRNSRKTHPFQAKFNRNSNMLHAETHALLQAMKVSNDLTDCTIAVARVSRKTGKNGCSFPCSCCHSALDFVGIRSIVCFDVNADAVRIQA